MKTKSDAKDRFVIIMAGGRGERFWPVSREKTPKQLLALLGKKSFLQEAVDRVLPLVPWPNVLVITNEAQAPEVRRQLPKLPKENLVAEPCGRDTCAAVTLGAAIVGARSTTAVMAVLPADHVIPEEKKFQQVLEDSFDLAARGQRHRHDWHQAHRTGDRLRIHPCWRAPAASRGRETLQDRVLPGRAVRREAELRARARVL